MGYDAPWAGAVRVRRPAADVALPVAGRRFAARRLVGPSPRADRARSRRMPPMTANRTVPALLAAAAAALAVAAPAPAATQIGALPDAASLSSGPCTGGNSATVWSAMVDGVPVVPYRVPAGGGVITKFQARNAGPSGTSFSFRLIKPLQGASVLGGASITANSYGPSMVTTKDTRVPVSGGELLGITRPGNANGGDIKCVASLPNQAYAASLGDVSPGSEATAQGPAMGAPNVLATLEPDADKDGYGDETQDQCLGDPAAFAAKCPVSLRAAIVAAEASVPQGAVTVLAFQATNDGKFAAQKTTLSLGLPAGLELVATTPSTGSCTGPECSFGTLPAQGTATVLAAVRATTAGAKTLTAKVATTNPDAVAGDDATTATLDVTPAPEPQVTVVQQPAPPPVVIQQQVPQQQPALCRVPKLKGLSLAAARKALVAATCAPGRVAKPKARVAASRLRVAAQGIPAGTYVKPQTKVALTLKAPAAKRR